MYKKAYDFLPYIPKLRPLARALRKNGTPAEGHLWKYLKARALGYEFHRQVPIDEFIVDLFCPKLKLAIEIDGINHNHEETYLNDVDRQARLEQLGVRFLRFDEMWFRRNVDGAISVIRDWIISHGLGVE